MILANCVEGLTKEALLDCFISGLKDAIHRDVITQSPISLIRVASLARLFDDKFALSSSFVSPQPKHHVSSNKPLFHLPLAPFSSTPKTLPPLLLTPSTKPYLP